MEPKFGRYYLWMFELGGDPSYEDGAMLILCENHAHQKGIEECRRLYFEMLGPEKHTLSTIHHPSNGMPILLPHEPPPAYQDGSGLEQVYWVSTHVWAVERYAKPGVVMYHHHSG